MKEKIKRFLIDKKELLMFIAVVLVVFGTVITIATLALREKPVNQEPTINEETPVIVPPVPIPLTTMPTLPLVSL